MEVVAMVISAVIGFIAGIVATILIRETPRPAARLLPRHRTDYDTGPHSVFERGFGLLQTRSVNAEPPQEDDIDIITSVNTTTQQEIVSVNTADRRAVLTPVPAEAPVNVTTRHGAPIAMLLVESTGQRWLLRSGESASIGRFDDNVIAIDDDEVSRLHAQISHRTDTGAVHEFTIFDYTSTNGTLVNGKPIRGVASLQDGDVVKIGNTELCFRRVRRD
jgi:hypothetical protein